MSSAPTPQLQRRIVKQVLSGDTVVLRDVPKGGKPKEYTVSLSNVIAPKLARRPMGENAPTEFKDDEPFAWEAREFLRKKLIGRDVLFAVESKSSTETGRDFGYIYLGKDATGENVAESVVAEGLADVRENPKPSEEHKRLMELKKQAEVAGKGKFGPNPQDHVRAIKWTIDNPLNFVESLHNKPVKAVVENVRDGCTVRAFLLPDFHYVTVMMTGIRCPMMKFVSEKPQEPEEYFEEAKFCTESRLLQRDVEITFDTVNNNNFFGTVHHPQGNIAEVLLRNGFARCVDWTLSLLETGREKMRAAEKEAKEKRLRLWKNYVAPAPQVIDEKEFSGKVVEVCNADTLVLKLADDSLRRITLSSIQLVRADPPAKMEKAKEIPSKSKSRLYDVPFMYEAREFLRQKLIGKKVSVTVDYIQPENNARPKRLCCTVMINGMNVAEAMVSKGLASVIRYRQDDDQRSSYYNDLLAAENKAKKSKKGKYSNKEPPTHRVNDVSMDYATAKQFFPFLQRAGRCEAIVEYVASGARLRLYIPRETCLVTFLLAGITCPKPKRVIAGSVTEGEPKGEEALSFTKDLCMQKEVEVVVDNMDKAGNFIGWLWIESNNLSVALVEEGLASVHFTAERSNYARALQNAQDAAKAKKLNMWENYEEPKEIEVKEEVVERVKNYKTVVITAIHPDFHFFAQDVDQGPKLVQLMEQMRQEMVANPPLVGAFTPKKGAMCAAKYIDDTWYRAKIEKIQGSSIHIIYVDYGNREITKAEKLATLLPTFHNVPAFAHEYMLACVIPPPDHDYHDDAQQAFRDDTENQELLLNVEYRDNGIDYVTLAMTDAGKEDVAKSLISQGLLICEQRKEKRLKKLIEEYSKAQESAKKERLNMWCYGDFLDDDAKEFGYQRS